MDEAPTRANIAMEAETWGSIPQCCNSTAIIRCCHGIMAEVLIFAGNNESLAQLVEHATFNRGVMGSNPI